jgi:hypothetical protein
MDSALISVAVAVGVIILGALTAWLTVRRTASGKIGTSEASVLWEQAQAMRAELVAQRDKAMEQRDRLIESQSAAIIPALALITQSLHHIGESLARLELRNGRDDH